MGHESPNQTLLANNQVLVRHSVCIVYHSGSHYLHRRTDATYALFYHIQYTYSHPTYEKSNP